MMLAMLKGDYGRFPAKVRNAHATPHRLAMWRGSMENAA
jgi:hypothetical protein